MTSRLRKTADPSPPLAPQRSRRARWPGSQAADRSQAAEGFPARALTASGLGAWAWDPATNLVVCSPDLEALCGLAPGTFDGTLEAILRVVYPDDRHLFIEASRQTLEMGRDYHSIYRIIHPDEAVRWIEAKGQVVRDSAGAICGMTGVSMDITARIAAEEEARERESRLQALADNVPVLIARLDTERRYVFANRAYNDLLGIPPADMLGRTMAEVLGAEVYETVRPYVDRVLAGEVVEYDATVSYRTVGTRFMHGAYAPERGSDGTVCGFLLSAMDITARVEAEEAARRGAEATRRLALIVENSHEAIISTDLDCRILSWNRGAERLYGWTPEEAIGKGIGLTFPPEQASQDMCRLLESLERVGGILEYEAVRIHQDGTQREVAVTFSPVRDAAEVQTGRAFIVRDITAQKEAERERARLLAQTEALLAEATERADRDPLTELFNHRCFHKTLMEEAGRARREGTFLAVAMLDLDHFKFFNDAYGHPVGDDALRRVADALRECCRPYDTPARFGGDEFAVLMPGVGRDEAHAVAARLARSLEGISIRPPGCIEDVPLRLSVGLAVFPDGDLSPLETVALADQRLYCAKSGGEEAPAEAAEEGSEKAAPGAADDAGHLRGRLTGAVQGFSMLDALVTAVDNKDRYTRRHSEDVMAHSLHLARALGLGEAERQTVAAVALLHDVGKIGIPDQILRKPGRLTEEEFDAVRLHPRMGAVIVGAVPGLEEMLGGICHHHERWDGLGYPDGLAGEAIPLVARLLAVADAYSAMTSDRPYRPGMSVPEALRLLEAGAGTQWDPACVAAFLNAPRPASK